MRVAPPHLLLEPPRHGFRVEAALLIADHDLKREVQQQVAELVTQRRGVAVVNRLVELEHLLDEVRPERFGGLGAVPGAAAAKISNQGESAPQCGVR